MYFANQGFTRLWCWLFVEMKESIRKDEADRIKSSCGLATLIYTYLLSGLKTGSESSFESLN